MRLCFVVPAIAFLLTLPGASASGFLDSRLNQEVEREIVERSLLSELGADTPQLRRFEEEFRPMYTAMPKNEHGALEPAVVRYVLHRYFVQQRGWYVAGLEPAGQEWNSSAPSSIVASRVPAYIQSLFEERLHGQGMSLHDVAVFAATLSDISENNALSDIVDLYSAFGLPTTAPASKRDVEHVIKAYLLQILFVDGRNAIKSRRDVYTLEAFMAENFPSWSDLMLWVHDMRQTISLERSHERLVSTERTLESVFEEVQALNHHLSAYQDIECRSIKAALADIEHKSTGRVLLSDFYRAGLNGDHMFVEHADYLRSLGVLDESDPSQPSIIIANYLGSRINCFASTAFHSVCCFDECEGLMGHLERSVAAPSAIPGRISELVSALQSDTVDAPRNLSAPLLARLEEIADHHGGLVPLHGRLFAQWMHHAYPLECPYPHTAGTASPLTPDEWMEESGAADFVASWDERQRHIVGQDSSMHVMAETLPWLPVEELVATNHAPAFEQAGLGLARKFCVLVAIVALAVPITKASATVVATSEAKAEKYMV